MSDAAAVMQSSHRCVLLLHSVRLLRPSDDCFLSCTGAAPDIAEFKQQDNSTSRAKDGG